MRGRRRGRQGSRMPHRRLQPAVAGTALARMLLENLYIYGYLERVGVYRTNEDGIV